MLQVVLLITFMCHLSGQHTAPLYYCPVKSEKSCFEDLQNLLLSFYSIAAQGCCLCNFKILYSCFCIIVQPLSFNLINKSKFAKSVLANNLSFNYEDVCHSANTVTHVKHLLWSSAASTFCLLPLRLQWMFGTMKNVEAYPFPWQMLRIKNHCSKKIKKKKMMIKHMIAVQ